MLNQSQFPPFEEPDDYPKWAESEKEENPLYNNQSVSLRYYTQSPRVYDRIRPHSRQMLTKPGYVYYDDEVWSDQPLVAPERVEHIAENSTSLTVPDPSVSRIEDAEGNLEHYEVWDGNHRMNAFTHQMRQQLSLFQPVSIVDTYRRRPDPD